MLLFAAAALAAATPELALAEARHALDAGRLDQTATMITAAVGIGANGEPVDRLTADLAFARRDWLHAAPIYVRLSNRHMADALIAERAGIASLERGDIALAAAMLDRATALPSASWRAWNARGALADRQGAWEAADDAYSRALALAPERAEIANNRGWSLLLRGRWREAEAELARGAALSPGTLRIANNLELARAAIAADLPQRRAGEADDAWAARLNDAGVVAAMRGERSRAIAAFSRAIELRASWDPRAAANLAAIGTVR